MGELLLGGWGGDTAQGICPWLAANLANLGEGGGEAVYHSRLSWGWEAPMTSFLSSGFFSSPLTGKITGSSFFPAKIDHVTWQRWRPCEEYPCAGSDGCDICIKQKRGN